MCLLQSKFKKSQEKSSGETNTKVFIYILETIGYKYAIYSIREELIHSFCSSLLN